MALRFTCDSSKVQVAPLSLFANFTTSWFHHWIESQNRKRIFPLFQHWVFGAPSDVQVVRESKGFHIGDAATKN